MAAPVLQSKGTAAFTDGVGAVEPIYPASLAAGDIVWLWSMFWSNAGGDGEILTPTGFTPAARATYRSSGGVSAGRGALFWKRCAGGETGTVSVTWSSANKGTLRVFGAQMYRTTGGPATGVPWRRLLVAGEHLQGLGNATITWPALQVAASENTVLAFIGNKKSGTPASTPTGYAATLAADLFDGPSTSDLQLAVFDKQNTSNGDAATASNGASAGWLGVHVVLHPTEQSAWNHLGHRGSTVINATSGTQIMASPVQAIPAGSVLVVRAATDNLSTASGDTSDHALVDDAGNIYVKLGERTRSSGAPADGVTLSLWATKITAQLETSAVLTLTVAGAVTVKTLALEEYSVPEGQTFESLGAVGTSGTGTAPSVTLDSLADAEHLWLGAVGSEGPLSDGFSQDAPDFTGGTSVGSTNTGGAAVKSVGGHRAWAGTAETFNITTGNRDWAALLVALDAVEQTAIEIALDVAAMPLVAGAVQIDEALALAVAELPVTGAVVGVAQIVDLELVTFPLDGLFVAATGEVEDLGRDLDPALDSWDLEVVVQFVPTLEVADMEAAGQLLLVNDTLAVAPTSFPVTGQAFEVQEALDLEVASLPVTGQALALNARTQLAIDAASFPVTGIAPEVNAEQELGLASFPVTGQAVVPDDQTVINLDPASFTVTGQTLGENAQTEIAFVPASLTLASEPVEVNATTEITVSAASFPVIGQAISPAAAADIALDPASFAVTGQALNIQQHLVVQPIDAAWIGQAIAQTADQNLAVTRALMPLTGPEFVTAALIARAQLVFVAPSRPEPAVQVP